MTNLFKKAAVFCDIHFGLKNNSTIHNQDCEDFVDWYIKKAKENNCDVGIFMGDWHNNRNSLNITTMDYSLRALEKLGAAFDDFYFYPGNHDLYYKDKRDVHSVEFGKYIPGITVITEPTNIGNVTLCPWLVNDEWTKIGKKGGKYIFGHFELPHFFMNAMTQMPDHGELNLESFKNFELGFSGHFHKRQNKGNMHYIGNAFPHNYSDAGDYDRGMMILEWGGQPQFHTWDAQPTYHVTKLSTLLANDSYKTFLKPNQHIRVTLDYDISILEATEIKEMWVELYKLRELVLIPASKIIELNNDINTQLFESIDNIVAAQINLIESDSINKNVLLSIYGNL